MLSKADQGGKRVLRVYPPWDETARIFFRDTAQ